MRNLILSTILIVFVIGAYSCNPQKRLAKKKSAYMEKVFKEIKDSVQEVQVTILKDTVKVLFPENLLFETAKSNVEIQNKPLLSRFAKALNKYEKTNILINGYTDNTGTLEFNKQLSLDRAVNAKAVLLAENVNAERILTWGRAYTNPIASNNTKEGRRLNRRVEFIILYNYQPKK